jgi:hypothetical protein
MPERRRDDRGRGRGDAVGGEDRVVGPGFAREPLVSSARISTARSAPRISLPRKVKGSAACSVAKWTSSYVISSWFCRACTSETVSTPMAWRGTHGQPQELGVAGRHGVVIGRAVDEVVGQVGATLAEVDFDVVDGEVELLEGEAADLADHAGDELVGSLGERVPSDQAGPPVAFFSTPRKPLASRRSAPLPRSPRECRRRR